MLQYLITNYCGNLAFKIIDVFNYFIVGPVVISMKMKRLVAFWFKTLRMWRLSITSIVGIQLQLHGFKTLLWMMSGATRIATVVSVNFSVFMFVSYPPRVLYYPWIEQRRHSALQKVVCHEVTCPPK